MGNRKFDSRKRWIRHRRVRKNVRGVADRPRLAVFRSSNHIYAQVISEDGSSVKAAASTLEKDLRAGSTGNVEGAAKVGALIAERAKAAGLSRVAFDRSGYKYHGRIKALADAAREGGLEF